MKQPRVFIIILNWNGSKDTIECINSVNKIDYKNYEIVIVDNASTDSSVSILRKKFPNIRLIENKENNGFSAGCNTGIKYALKEKADHVLLLNNDTLVTNNFLSELVTTYNSMPKLSIISPVIYYAANPETIWSSGLMKNFHSYWPFKDIDRFKKDVDENRYVDYLTGCCMLLSKNVLKKNGLFSEKYFMYIEDMDYSARARKNDILLITAAKSKIWHKIGQSIKKKSEASIRYFFIRNLIFFFRNNYTFSESFIFYLFFLKGCVYEILNNTLNKNFLMVKAFIIGLIHGLIGKTGYYELK